MGVETHSSRMDRPRRCARQQSDRRASFLESGAHGFLAGLLVAVSLQGAAIAGQPRAAATAPQAADLFKTFLEHPPAYVDAFWRDATLGLSTNFQRLRYQADGFLYGSASSNLLTAGKLNRLDSYNTLIGRFGDVYWARTGDTYSCWTNDGTAADQGNTIYRGNTFTEAIEAGEILGMRLDIRPGGIRWTGDDFIATNENQTLVLRGRLERDTLGRASCMTVLKTRLSPTPGEEPFAEVDRYSYGAVSGFLPSVISGSVYHGEKGLVLAFETHILWIHMDFSPHGPDEFLYDPFQFATLREYRVESNGFLVSRYVNHGKLLGTLFTMPDGPLVKRLNTRANWLYFALALLVLLAPLFFMWRWHRRAGPAEVKRQD
jgi:hypothetical protein